MRGIIAACCAAGIAFSLTAGCSRNQQIHRIAPDELKSMLDRKADFVFVDVRRPEELQVMGTLPGYLNIPLEVFPDRWPEVPRGKPVVVACNRAQRAARAASILAGHGYGRLSICALNEYRERGYALIHPKVAEVTGGQGPAGAER